MGVIGSVEGELPTQQPNGDENSKLIFRIDGLLHRALDKWADKIHILSSRRHPPDRGPDPDYAKPLDQLENIRTIIREEIGDRDSGIQITNHPRPPKNESWQNKILVGVAVTVISAVILGAFTTWALVQSLKAEMTSYMKATDQRLDRDEHQIDETQRRLDRGAT